jgi:hypothetical protein
MFYVFGQGVPKSEKSAEGEGSPASANPLDQKTEKITVYPPKN